MTIELYFTKVSPPCRSVLLLAKHIDLDIKIIDIDLLNGEHLTAEYLNMNRSHTVPTIVDNGFVLWESRAILQYLCNKYAPESDLYATDPKRRARIDRMLNFDIGMYYNSIRDAFFPVFFHGHALSDNKLAILKTNLNLLELFIGNNKFVSGTSLSIADLSLHSSTSLLSITDINLREFPNVFEWYERLQNELPYYQEVNGNLRNILEDYIDKTRRKFATK